MLTSSLPVFRLTSGRLFRVLPVLCVLCLAASVGAPASAQTSEGGTAQTIVTAVPKDRHQTAPVARSAIRAEVNRKDALVSDWIPLRGPQSRLELVLLIDGAARSTLGLHFDELSQFVGGLPRNSRVGVAYMRNGRAVFEQPLTSSGDEVMKALHLPGGPPGSSASPYFCLSDLIKQWPTTEGTGGAPSAVHVRREVLMITDGLEPYGGARFDPDNPYVRTAVRDAQRAGVIVHAIYFRSVGGLGTADRTAFIGQNYLNLSTQATGGRAYYLGTSSPVSFIPYLDDLHTRLMNQYELVLTVPQKSKASLQPLKVKTSAHGATVEAPDSIWVRSGTQ